MIPFPHDDLPPLYTRTAVCTAANISRDQYHRITAEFVGAVPDDCQVAWTEDDILTFAITRALVNCGLPICDAVGYAQRGKTSVRRGLCRITVDMEAVRQVVDIGLNRVEAADPSDARLVTRQQLAEQRETA